jgi:hypothetical protein
MKIRNLFLFFFVAALLVACGGSSSNPVKIAEEFVTAYLNADYDKCNEMMEDDEFNPSSKMSSAEKAVVNAMKGEAEKMQFLITVDNEYTDIDTEDADVYFDITSETDSEFKETMRVSLEKDDNGKWIVGRYKEL